MPYFCSLGQMPFSYPLRNKQVRTKCQIDFKKPLTMNHNCLLRHSVLTHMSQTQINSFSFRHIYSLLLILLCYGGSRTPLLSVGYVQLDHSILLMPYRSIIGNRHSSTHQNITHKLSLLYSLFYELNHCNEIRN